VGSNPSIGFLSRFSSAVEHEKKLLLIIIFLYFNKDNLSMDDIFCFIEDEHKAFEIIKLYYEKTININNEDEKLAILHNLDNQIQIKEINTHIYLNHISESKCLDEKMHWINCYASSFRSYLNTLKIIFLIFYVNNINLENLSFNEFCILKDKINKNRAFLNIIHA